MSVPYVSLGADPSNPSTHVIISVGGREFSVFSGSEQDTADSIGDVVFASRIPEPVVKDVEKVPWWKFSGLF